ncbi:TonB-dependent receptor [Hydrogenimonas sp.]
MIKIRNIARFGMLSVAATLALQAQELSLSTVEVEETVDATVVKDVAGEEVRSADLAEALYKLDPDVQIVRRSGIANDIILRGMRKDNINVLIDGGKLYGGCPNRMDPPISHVLASNVDHIVIKEGPYDVEHFGTLSGLVDVVTKAPEAGFHSEGDLNIGSWSYKKVGVSASGGSDKVRVFVGGSVETSGQYEDGDGRTLAEQLDEYVKANPTQAGRAFKPQDHDMNSFRKDTAMVKLFADITDSQKVEASYTINRSKNILYPNTPMDAKKDDSDLFNIEYTVADLGEWSKELSLSFYNSWVYHPMGTYFRKSSNTALVENVMDSRIYGGKIKNGLDLFNGRLSFGIDASKRRWDGDYRKNGAYWGKSIDDAVTKNGAFFADFKKSYDRFDMEAGLRYDHTKITTDEAGIEGNDYDALGGYLYGTYNIGESLKIFGGLGKASRVPDGKELYFRTNPKMGAKMKGTPTLDQTSNYQVDAGVEKMFGDTASLKMKLFYSKLKDFIAYNKTKSEHNYENVDAKIYGLSLEGTYAFTDTLYLDGGASWMKGRKDHPLSGQSDKDMPNIPPLKGTLGLNWDYSDNGTLRASMVAADSWDDYDADNGEQKIPAYAVFNLKATHQATDRLEVTAGVDNIFDRTYAVTNTYADMTLVSGGDPMLLNEPGRYIYCNVAYRF